jgi:hypothetical protein
MSTLQSESTGAVIQGTDNAIPSISKPPVEVTFETTKKSGASLDPADSRAGRVARGIAAIQAKREAHGKVPAPKAELAKIEKPVEKKPNPAPEVKAAAKAPEPKVETAPVAAPEAKPEAAAEADEPEKPDAEPDTKPDPVEVSTLRADLAAAKAELAMERSRSRKTDDTSDRDAYVSKPTDWLRNAVARQWGLKPDAPEVNAELAFFQQELTIDAIGADTLDDSRKQQRVSDRLERADRLNQLGRAASEATSRETQQRQQLVGRLSAVFDGARSEFPELDFVAQQFGTSSAEVAEQALTRWTAMAREGLIQVTGDDAKDFREALRLIDTDLKTRLGKLQRPQPQNTAPAPAPAPAQASPTGSAPGAAVAQQSTAPGPKKPASASPKTLPPQKAAAAPAVTAAPDDKTQKPSGPRVIDPDERGGHSRRVNIALERLRK